MVSDYSHLIKHFSDHELPRDDEAFDTGEEQEVNRVRRRRLAGGADGQLDEGRAPLSVRNLRGISEVLGVHTECHENDNSEVLLAGQFGKNHLVFVVLHEVEGQAPHERQVPFARVDILRAAVRGGGGRRGGPSLLLDEEEGPEVVGGHREEGDEILGLDHLTLRHQIHFCGDVLKMMVEKMTWRR